MYRIASAVPFDMVIDTDMGLWKLIQKEYQNPRFFIPSVLNERNMDIMKVVLTDRPFSNPLKLFMKPEYIGEADALYDQFMKERYKEIVELSCCTGIFDIIRRSKSVDDTVKFDIYYKSDLERKTLLKRFGKYEITPSLKRYKEYTDIPVKDDTYGSIYVKDYQDILLFNEMEGKNIIVGKYRFNMEEGLPNIPLKDITKEVILFNVVKIIDMYPIDPSVISVG